MGAAVLPPSLGHEALARLRSDGRVIFAAEPEGLDAEFVAALGSFPPSPGAIGDAYLAAFALAADLRLVTFDRGFRRFHMLDVEVLEAGPGQT